MQCVEHTYICLLHIALHCGYANVLQIIFYGNANNVKLSALTVSAFLNQIALYGNN